MGTFTGHALPGGFFILWSVFHTYQICRQYFDGVFLVKNNNAAIRCRRRSERRDGSGDDDSPSEEEAEAPHYCSTSNSRHRGHKTNHFYASNIYFCFGIRRIPVDSYLKLFAAVAGITGEIITAFDQDWRFAHYGNLQHIAMFGMFGLYALVEALTFVGAPLPVGTDYGVLILAYAGEAILFAFHLHGRDRLDVTLHTLLVYTIWACAVSSVLEMSCRRNVIAPLARTYFTLLQGLWFYIVGFIMYNPLPGARAWDATNHDHMLLAVALYVWAGGSVIVLMLAISMLAYLVTRRKANLSKYGIQNSSSGVSQPDDTTTMIKMNGHVRGSAEAKHSSNLSGSQSRRHLTEHVSDDGDDEVEHFRL